jgi:hypothetical protein
MGIVEAPASDRPNFTAMASLWLKVRIHANLFIRTKRGEGPVHVGAGIAYCNGLRAFASLVNPLAQTGDRRCEGDHDGARKPTTNMPEIVTKTRSIDLGCSPPKIKSKCLERLSSRYV